MRPQLSALLFHEFHKSVELIWYKHTLIYRACINHTFRLCSSQRHYFSQIALEIRHICAVLSQPENIKCIPAISGLQRNTDVPEGLVPLGTYQKTTSRCRDYPSRGDVLHTLVAVSQSLVNHIHTHFIHICIISETFGLGNGVAKLFRIFKWMHDSIILLVDATSEYHKASMNVYWLVNACEFMHILSLEFAYSKAGGCRYMCTKWGSRVARYCFKLEIMPIVVIFHSLVLTFVYMYV